jgi:predicted glycoside hydrolase/deacetylase ChbG (UPF0249 family)
VRCASERQPHLWALVRQNAGATATLIRQYLQSRTLDLLAMNSRTQLREAGLCFPTDFYGITQTGFLDHEQLARILRALRPGASELMCHPGTVDDKMAPTLTRLRSERQRELDALTRPETLQLVAQLGIHLINYRGLIPS